jgi:YCII-related domain-containing protein
MKKFLVLYRMDMAEMQKMMANSNDEERKKGMAKWEAWMKRHMTSMADRGGPVGKTKRVATSGITDTRNDVGGYSIVQAESQEAAAALFADSPHLTMPGAIAEVMEIMSMPRQ